MTDFSDPTKPPYPKEQAGKLLRRFLGSSQFSGNYRLVLGVPHFQARLRERNLTVNDALNILKTGKVTDEPEFENGTWRYRVTGETVTRKGKAILVVCFASATEVRAITIMRKRS